MFVEEVDDVVVQVQLVIGVLGIDRLARVAGDDQLQSLARGDVGSHPLLGADQGGGERQLAVILEFLLAEIEPQRVEPQEDLLGFVVRRIDAGGDVQIRIDPRQKFGRQRLASCSQSSLRQLFCMGEIGAAQGRGDGELLFLADAQNLISGVLSAEMGGYAGQ